MFECKQCFYKICTVENKFKTTEVKLMQTNIEYKEQCSDIAVYLLVIRDVFSYNSCVIMICNKI